MCNILVPHQGLDHYEKGLASKFECKMKGRLGVEPGDLKEMRVLNRIVRITDEGLNYEADPRHAELLVKSMGLERCKHVATPCVKKAFKESAMDLVLDDDKEEEIATPVVSASLKIDQRKVTFYPKVQITNVPGYSGVYGSHPGSSCSPRI